MSLLREYYMIPSSLRFFFFLALSSLSIFFVEIVFYRNMLAFVFPIICIYLLVYMINLGFFVSYLWKNGAYDFISKLSAGILISAMDFFYFGYGLIVTTSFVNVLQMLLFSLTLYSIFGFVIPVSFAEIFLGSKDMMKISQVFKISLLSSIVLYGIYSACVYASIPSYFNLAPMILAYISVCILLYIFIFNAKRVKFSTIVLLSLRASTMRNLKYLLIILYLTTYFILHGAPQKLYAFLLTIFYILMWYLLKLRIKLIRKKGVSKVPGSKIILSLKHILLIFVSFLVSGFLGLIFGEIISQAIAAMIFLILGIIFQCIGALILVLVIFDTLRLYLNLGGKNENR